MNKKIYIYILIAVILVISASIYDDQSMILEPKIAGQESLKKAAEDLKLQGISWGDRPTAMILWQTDKESKMYFLIKGQSIGSTGIKVKTIYKNRVTIELEGSEMELL